MKKLITFILFYITMFVAGVFLGNAFKGFDGWEVSREDKGHACIEYTKGGTKITTFVSAFEHEEGSEICHGELVEARQRWEIKKEGK